MLTPRWAKGYYHPTPKGGLGSDATHLVGETGRQETVGLILSTLYSTFQDPFPLTFVPFLYIVPDPGVQ